MDGSTTELAGEKQVLPEEASQADSASVSPLDIPCLDMPQKVSLTTRIANAARSIMSPLGGAPNDKQWKSDAYFKSGILRVKFVDKIRSDQLRKDTLKWAQEWSKYAGVTFVEVGINEAAEIRISFRRKAGHWSAIGTDSLPAVAGDTKPSMNLDIGPESVREEARRVVLHEFGHALGLVHEHQLPENVTGIAWNRKNVLAYYKGRGWTDKQIEENVFRKYDSADFEGQYLCFDPQSIMIYPIPASLGCPVVEMNKNLSNADKEYIAKIYPKNSSPTRLADGTYSPQNIR